MIDDYDAIILAGGRGRRFGGPDKPVYAVAGRRLLDIALAAAAGARRIVVVGDVGVPEGVLLTREEPPFGGPVAGVRAGLAALAGHEPWTLLLACDLPDAEAAVRVLLQTTPEPGHDGVCLLDADRRRQWLLGCYRTAALSAQLAGRSDAVALHQLLGPLDLLGADAGMASVADLDTRADAVAWAARYQGGER